MKREKREPNGVRVSEKPLSSPFLIERRSWMAVGSDPTTGASRVKMSLGGIVESWPRPRLRPRHGGGERRAPLGHVAGLRATEACWAVLLLIQAGPE